MRPTESSCAETWREACIARPEPIGSMLRLGSSARDSWPQFQGNDTAAATAAARSLLRFRDEFAVKTSFFVLATSCVIP